jgi:hypothetical protein
MAPLGPRGGAGMVEWLGIEQAGELRGSRNGGGGDSSVSREEHDMPLL